MPVGRHDRDLRIAIAMRLAEFEGAVPGGAGVGDQTLVGAGGGVERNRRHRQLLIALAQAMRRAAVVADDAQHRRLIALVAGEGAAFLGHFGRSGVADAGHDRREGAAISAALGGVVAEAARHQQPADIGEAEAQRAVFIGKLGDFARRELRHQHRDFKHQRPQAHGVFIGRNVEDLCGRIAELQQVQRGEIAGRVVEEHIFRARVRRADFAAGRAGVPVVDGGVELQAGIGGSPGGIADLVPKLARGQLFRHLAVDAPRQRPFPIRLHRA